MFEKTLTSFKYDFNDQNMFLSKELNEQYIYLYRKQKVINRDDRYPPPPPLLLLPSKLYACIYKLQLNKHMSKTEVLYKIVIMKSTVSQIVRYKNNIVGVKLFAFAKKRYQVIY